MIDLDAIFERLRKIIREELAQHHAAPVGMLSPKEFARRNGVSVSLVRNAIKDGRVPAEKKGRAVRIPADATLGKPVRANTGGDTAVRADQILKLVKGGAR